MIICRILGDKSVTKASYHTEVPKMFEVGGLYHFILNTTDFSDVKFFLENT